MSTNAKSINMAVLTSILLILWFGFWPNDIDAFGLPKAVLTVAIVVPYFLYSMVLLRSDKLVPNDWLIAGPLLAFVLFAVLGMFAAEDPGGALFGSPHRYQGATVQLMMLGLMLAVWYQHRERHIDIPQLAQWLTVIVLVAIPVALAGYLVYPVVFQADVFAGRVFGLLGNPNDFALLLLLALPVTATIKHWTKWPTVLMIGFGLLATGSRTGIGLFLVWMLVESMRQHAVIRKRTMVAVIALLVVLFLIFTLRIERVRGSAVMRLDMVVAGVNMSLDRPLLGYGHDVYWPMLQGYLPNHLKEPGTDIIDRVHSAPVDRALAAGIPYAIAYECLLIAIVIRYLQVGERTKERDALCLGLVLGHIFVLGNIVSISSLMMSGIYAGLLIPRLQA